MISRQIRLLLIVACGLALCAAGPALGQTVNLNNGVAGQGDGYLEVNVDAYGSWASSNFGGGGDTYNPIGGGPPLAAKGVIFSNGFFLFNGGNQRELLADNGMWQMTGTPDFGDDTSLDREITSAIVENAGVATSQFRVFGGAFDVTFDVTQSLSPPVMDGDDPGSFVLTTAYGDGVDSTLYQTYVGTNNNPGAGSVTFQMVRAVDADILFAPGAAFNDDEVGTDTNAGPPGITSVWQGDVDANGAPNPVTRVTTSGDNNGGAYYGGLMNETPPEPPGGVAFGYGTDVQVWDAFGVPENWKNYVAQVGYDTDGNSGAGVSQDGFHGVEFIVTLVPEPSCLALCSLLGMGLLAFRRRLS